MVDSNSKLPSTISWSSVLSRFRVSFSAVGDEEPRLVLDDRSAEAELVVVGVPVLVGKPLEEVGGVGRPGSHDERVVRILVGGRELLVVELGLILPVGVPVGVGATVQEVAVEHVGARLDDDVGGRADHAAVLGAHAAGLERDLGGGGGGHEHPAAAEARERGVDAVDEHRVVGEVRAVDLRPSALDGAVLGVAGDAGKHVDDAVVGAVLTGRLRAHLAGDRGAGGDVELVDHRRLGGDGDGLRRLQAHGEVHVRLAARGHVHRVVTFREALECGLHRVGAGRDQAEAVGAGLVGHGHLLAATALEGDLHAGQRLAVGVDDLAGDQPGLRTVGQAPSRRETERLTGTRTRELDAWSRPPKGGWLRRIPDRPGRRRTTNDPRPSTSGECPGTRSEPTTRPGVKKGSARKRTATKERAGLDSYSSGSAGARRRCKKSRIRLPAVTRRPRGRPR